MIAFAANRPALQIGRHQVVDYDVEWLDDALRRAAEAADHSDFPFIEEICKGIVQYLETKCPLKLMHVDDLYGRLRRMLMKIGCQPIADKLEPAAPPVSVSLVQAALEAGSGYELAFFRVLRDELGSLKSSGVGEVRLTGLRASVLILRGTAQWNKGCELLLAEIHSFFATWDLGQAAGSRPLRLVLDKSA